MDQEVHYVITNEKERAKIRWATIIVLVTIVLIGNSIGFSYMPIPTLILLTAAISLANLIQLQLLQRRNVHICMRCLLTIIDIVGITYVTYYTGGTASAFYLLYFLHIVSSGLRYGTRDSLFTIIVVNLAYVGMVGYVIYVDRVATTFMLEFIKILLLVLISLHASFVTTSKRKELIEQYEQLAAINKKISKAIEDKTRELEAERRSLENKVKQRTQELEKARANLEKRVEERTEELSTNLAQLKRINRLMVDREMVIIDLKKENKALEAQLARTEDQ